MRNTYRDRANAIRENAGTGVSGSGKSDRKTRSRKGQRATGRICRDLKTRRGRGVFDSEGVYLFGHEQRFSGRKCFRGEIHALAAIRSDLLARIDMKMEVFRILVMAEICEHAGR